MSYHKPFKVAPLDRPVPPKIIARSPWLNGGGGGGGGIDPACAILDTEELFRGEDPACTILDCEDGNPIELES